MKYIKQLDTVRALAVILVIIHHWLPTIGYLNFLPNGEIGVETFFVLSGFLITSILLNNKLKQSTDTISKTSLLKNFYARRVLRIFPIYYLAIIIIFIFSKYSDTSIKESFYYYFTYTQNFYFYFHGWDDMLSPYWTLAVEEQFYLLWPLIILFISRKYLLQIFFAFIIMPTICQHYFNTSQMSFVFPWRQFDAFGIGALLSYVVVYKPGFLKRFFGWITFFLIVEIILFITRSPFGSQRLVILIAALFVITYIVCYHNSPTFKCKIIFNNNFLIFLGKISYGLYLYHTVAVKINSKFLDIYFNPLLPDVLYKRFWGQLFLIENIMILVLISWLSYKYIERPFLKLKKNFRYIPAASANEIPGRLMFIHK